MNNDFTTKYERKRLGPRTGASTARPKTTAIDILVGERGGAMVRGRQQTPGAEFEKDRSNNRAFHKSSENIRLR